MKSPALTCHVLIVQSIVIINVANGDVVASHACSTCSADGQLASKNDVKYYLLTVLCIEVHCTYLKVCTLSLYTP